MRIRIYSGGDLRMKRTWGSHLSNLLTFNRMKDCHGNTNITNRLLNQQKSLTIFFIMKITCMTLYMTKIKSKKYPSSI